MPEISGSHIAIRGIHKSFGSLEALKGIDMDIRPGIIYGLLGPSGCGKTTLINIMAGILDASAGEVRIGDKKMPYLEAMNHIGYMAQSDALYRLLSGRENLRFFGRLYRMKRPLLEERIAQVAGLLELSDALDRRTGEYSGGMKRRLSLAAALLHDPDVLLLDEPTVGIDPLLRQSIWEELRRLADMGKNIFVTTHVMDEAERCDELSLMRAGRLVACGTPENVKRNAQAKDMNEAFIRYSKGGGDA